MRSSLGESKVYQSLFATSIDGIAIIDQRGIIQDVNDAMLDLMGYQKDELLNKNISMLMDSPHREKHDGYLQRYQETKEARIIGIGREVEARKKDGSVFPIRLAVSEFEVDGVPYYTGIIHDLTEEHNIKAKLNEHAQELELRVQERTASLERAQSELLSSQKLYEAIAQNFPNGTIGVLDPSFNILFMEGTELNQWGVGSERLLDENYIQLLPEEVRDEVKEHLEMVLQGEHRDFEIHSGEKVYLGRSVPLPNENGVIDKILQVDINVTKEKQAEEEIYNALMKEKQLNELKSNFVSMASHEFRTPLSSIQSSASLIKRYGETEQQDKRERHIDKIHSNVKNLNLILNDFLSLEKIEGGLIKNHPQELALTDFIHEILEETSPLKKAQQSISFDPAHEKDLISFDPFLLRNILNNLISNAFKYSSESGKILLSTKEDKQGIWISIQDEGIGISKQDQEQLFSRFYRASNATNIQGTGLGLNIVKRYAQLMEAELTFESELNKGSTFAIRLNT